MGWSYLEQELICGMIAGMIANVQNPAKDSKQKAIKKRQALWNPPMQTSLWREPWLNHYFDAWLRSAIHILRASLPWLFPWLTVLSGCECSLCCNMLAILETLRGSFHLILFLAKNLGPRLLMEFNSQDNWCKGMTEWPPALTLSHLNRVLDVTAQPQNAGPWFEPKAALVTPFFEGSEFSTTMLVASYPQIWIWDSFKFCQMKVDMQKITHISNLHATMAKRYGFTKLPKTMPYTRICNLWYILYVEHVCYINEYSCIYKKKIYIYIYTLYIRCLRLQKPANAVKG